MSEQDQLRAIQDTLNANGILIGQVKGTQDQVIQRLDRMDTRLNSMPTAEHCNRESDRIKVIERWKDGIEQARQAVAVGVQTNVRTWIIIGLIAFILGAVTHGVFFAGQSNNTINESTRAPIGAPK
jgi:hypothetical protein